jgi:hypothetical protein
MMTTRQTALAAAAAAVLTLGCEMSTAPADSVTLRFDFNSEQPGWAAAFTDYRVGSEDIMELESGRARLPQPLDTTRYGYMLSGMNRSDDLFMYLKKHVTGLESAGEYEVRFRAVFATNAPAGCIGAGGAPGESVVIKAGATKVEPLPVEEDDHWRLNVEKGEQMQEGSVALILGDVATTNTDCTSPVYQLKTLTSGSRTLRARADDQGGMWLFVGSESGFESRTRLYFTELEFTLVRVF